MIEYPGKIAGVILRGEQLLYVLARVTDERFQVAGCGTIALTSLANESRPLRGSKIICGISHTQYCNKRIKTVSGGITADPDSLLWELSRSCTEDIGAYRFSFLNLLSNDNSLDATEAFGVKRRTFERLGSLFEEHELVLHKLVFEPEALRQMTRKLNNGVRTAVILIEPDHVHLQLHAGGRLIATRSLHPVDVSTNSGRQKLAEEVGVLLMSAPGAQSVNRKLTLLFVGNTARSEFSSLLARVLPYQMEVRTVMPTDYGVESNGLLLSQFDRYYLPFSLAYLYHRELMCESSPAKNEAWS